MKTAESFYHAFTLGLLTYLKGDYYIHSNRESGYGRYDIELESISNNKPSFVFEFKLKGKEKIEDIISKAKIQIDNNKYVTNLKEKGKTNIHRFVFVFDGKDVTIEEI